MRSVIICCSFWVRERAVSLYLLDDTKVLILLNFSIVFSRIPVVSMMGIMNNSGGLGFIQSTTTRAIH